MPPKASQLLAKLIEKTEDELGITMNRNRRPVNTQDCKDLSSAERWRDDVGKEIDRKIEKLHTGILIRDLNDDVNKRIKEKYNWELRIRELGGPDYIRKVGTANYSASFGGVTVPGTKGYRYFGKALELPGVKELFEQAQRMQERVTPQELQSRVDADYFGLRDEEDGLLVEYERQMDNAGTSVDGSQPRIVEKQQAILE
ncbi:Isy1-like splicing factor [Gorgonomyces haynaldii]|nr:Isy1-like splicing factor [Gorgonomyces haynaldii]